MTKYPNQNEARKPNVEFFSVNFYVSHCRLECHVVCYREAHLQRFRVSDFVILSCLGNSSFVIDYSVLLHCDQGIALKISVNL
jgi:hypothetical protein